MNEEDYKIWKNAMYRGLVYFYSRAEAKYIIDFWDRIKGSTETEMLGEKGMEALEVLSAIAFDPKDTGIPWSARNASQWACRCWLYAPLLAAEYRRQTEVKKVNPQAAPFGFLAKPEGEGDACEGCAFQPDANAPCTRADPGRGWVSCMASARKDRCAVIYVKDPNHKEKK